MRMQREPLHEESPVWFNILLLSFNCGSREGETRANARESKKREGRLCSRRRRCCFVGTSDNEITQTARSARRPSLYMCAGPATKEEAKSQNNMHFTLSLSLHARTKRHETHCNQPKLISEENKAGWG